MTVNEGRADDLLVGLRDLLGGIHPKDTRDKVHRGMQGVVRDGRSAGGRAYGYCPVPSRTEALEIVEHEAEVVRRIHALRLDGPGSKAIAGALNRDGVLPPRGTTRNASTINGSPKRGYGLLSNPLYDGRQVWNRVGMVRDPDTGRRVRRDKPVDEWMEEPAEHPRIVPAEVFAAVQARRREQSIRKAEGRPIKRAVRPFSGLLRCALCGKGMAVHDRRGTAIRIKCATAVESGTCDHTGSARLDRIKGTVLGHLGGTLTDPAYLEAYVAAYQDERARMAGGPSRDIPAMERELAKARADHGRMVHLVVRGVVAGSDAEDRIRTLKQEVEAKAAFADAVSDDATIEVAPDAHERFAHSIGALSERLRDPDPIFDRDAMEVLRHLIDHIVVHPKSEDALNQIEVEGDLSALIAPIRGGWGGVGVAEEANIQIRCTLTLLVVVHPCQGLSHPPSDMRRRVRVRYPSPNRKGAARMTAPTDREPGIAYKDPPADGRRARENEPGRAPSA